MLFKKKSRVEDETTSSLVHSGVYHLSDTYDDEEAKKFGGPAPYGFWSAVKYTFTLSLILWWLPVFGQMIAGYVGGRRAGTPFKGVLAALIPVFVFFIISGLVKIGIIPTVIFGVDLTPSSVLGAIVTYVPVIQPYLDFASMYLHSFFASLETTANLGLDAYIITIAFAYVGGVISEQHRKELQNIVRQSSGPKTTVVLEGNTFSSGGPAQPLARRGAARSRGFDEMQPLGAESDGDEQTTLRSARRMMYDPEQAGSISVKDKKALKERATTMAQEQREVERKVQKKRAEEERPHRKGGDGSGQDWEFI